MHAVFAKRLLCAALLLGLLPLRGTAQLPATDQRASLRARLRTQPADTNRVLLLIELGQQYEASQPDSAKALYQRAGRLSEQLHYPRGVVKYIANYTGILNTEGRFAESERLNQQGIALSVRHHFRRYRAVSYGNLANVYLRQEKYPLAIATQLKALPAFEAIHDTASLALLTNSLSVCYQYLHQDADALRYGQQALALARPLHNDMLVAMISNSIGNAYKGLGRLPEATQALRRSYALGRRLHYVEAQKSAAINLADIDVQRGQPALALPLYQTAVQLADSLHDVEGLADAWKGLGRAYFELRQLGPAQQYGRQALASAQQHGANKVVLDCYDLLADIAVAQGQLAASRQLRYRADALGDSLLNTAVVRSAQEVEARYRVQQQRAVVAQQQRALAQQRHWLLAAGVGVGLLGLLLFTTYRYFRQRQKLDAQRLQTLHAEAETQRLQALLDGQAQERQRISQEMHDDLGAGLTGILYLSHALQGPPAQAGPAAARIGEAASQLSAKMNEVIWTLNDAHDTLESLVQYLRLQMAELLDNAGLDYAFEIDDDLPAARVPKELRRNVYLVVREAVHNAIKHADCQCVTISMHVRDGALQVCVRDDGRGLPVGEAGPAARPFGNGLANMRQRIAQLSGQLRFETAGEGTCVCLSVPLAV
ncbi:tetratricopeptide repeat protein [Hymenobacter cheonanensis]|uniref:tetratricopeptide repeat protein n=1 Tax=Hymenobacter sp. CA2-7 TaxID=3063993 RepID=UPI002713AA71|nr:tetratricopeptide repeat protein [Hymenobacter sp. CA2-7]MDO7884464.1 tetratricopeptide repeat protein [Hymenobacter sp. CA2-7]